MVGVQEIFGEMENGVGYFVNIGDFFEQVFGDFQ